MIDKQTALEALAAFEAHAASEARLQPGEQGWWPVWGASLRDVQEGDIIAFKNGDEVETNYVAGLFEAKAAPMRVGLIDQNHSEYTLGALVRIVLWRQGTKNTLSPFCR